MEVALLRIVTECGGKNDAVKTSAQEAYDLIVSQQINPLVEMHVLREKYLTTIELALDAKGSRLPQCGIDGLQLLLRDNQLHSLHGTRETVEQTLPMQALHTLHCMPSWNQEADIQCHCLTLIVQLMCSPQWVVGLDAIKVALELCLATYGSTRQASVRLAVRASVTQILNTFCSNLHKEQVEDATDDDYKHIFKNVTKLLSHCTQKLAVMTSSTEEAVIVIDAINTVLSSQTLVIQKHEPFIALLWQNLCPAIVKLLGDPTISASPRKLDADESAPVGQGQGASLSADQTIFDSPDIARAVYFLCGELLRLMAPMQEMNSALEALFHKALLFPKVEHRTEALKVFKKILSSPDRVVDILLTSLTADSQHESLTLWKILLDSIVECSCSDQLDISVAAVQCVNGLLASLTTLCHNDTQILPPDVVDRTHRNFKTLKSVDLPVFKYSSADECRKRLLLPQLSMDHDSTAGDSTAHTPTSQTPVVDQPPAINIATPPVASDDGSDDKEADMDSCMSNLAQRIGSALDGNCVDLRQQFQYVQTALKKEDERRSPRSADDDVSVATARRFVRALMHRLPAWMKMRSSIEVDETIQQFASEFYKEFTEEEESAFQRNEGHEIRILNADALYLTAYASIRFVLRHTRELDRETDFSEDAFVAEIFGSGCIVFASEAMVRSIYRGLLEHCTAENKITPSGLLLDVIEDYDGLSFLQMSDVNKLEKAARNTNVTLHCSAAKKLSRRLLTASWDGLVVVLSNLAEAVRVDGTNKSLSFFVHNLLHKSSGRQRAQTTLIVDGLSASLHGLHRLAHLCNTLSLRFRSGWIFGKLVEVSCPLDELRALSNVERTQLRAKKRVQSQQEKLRKWTLRRQDALSIEVVLDEAIDNGTHAPDCWKHVIRCTEYIWELEHYLFGSSGDQQSLKTISKGSNKEKASGAKEQQDSDSEDRPPVRLAHLAPMVGPAQQSVEDVLGKETADVLTAETAARVLCLLIAKTDRFYECVTRSLNLRALRQFMLALLTASESQLLYGDDDGCGLVDRCTLLRRLGVTIVDLASTGRPLVHSMHIWPVCTLHMIQAACAGQPAITASAIACLHDCVAALLTTEAEGFRFHEALFVPFQNVLCLDMCDEETQDQIVCILAEFVDTNADQIGSGWRPLFGALKAVRTSPGGCVADNNQLRVAHTTVLDVFGAFLKMDNRGVFCMAALDCINCLVHYLQATGKTTGSDEEGTDLQEDEDAREVAVARSALSYLVQIHTMMRSLYSMNRLPACHLLHRLLLRERAPQSVDETIEYLAPHMDDIGSLSSVLIEEPFFGSPGLNPSPVDLDQQIENPECSLPWTGLPVTQLAIIEVWLTLVEGLTGVAVTCPRSVQPELLQALSDMIESLRSCPGPDFGAYCLSHLVLPMLQNWLRRETLVGDGSGWRENRPSVRNFKQAFGLYTEVIVGFVRHDAARPSSRRLLLDMYRLINECIAQPSEFVSRLGCSCLRHLITCAGPVFGEEEWSITVHALWKTTCVTLSQLRLLMTHFFPGSNEYYGDCGVVQVALRKDSNPREASRVRALAQQVFLLDNQKFVENLEDRPDLLSQSDRSVVFLLNREKREDGESIVHRLPFRDVVVLLLSHQLLLQLIGSLLVEGTDLVVSGVGSLLLKQLVSSASAAKSRKATLPGVLPKLSASNITTLYLCLDASFQVAYEFDRRPGLKFLVQKVFNSSVAANLYKQTVTAWTLRSITMFEFVRRVDKSPKDVFTMFKDWDDDFSLEVSALDQDKDYLLRLADAFRRICRELCRVERTVAAEKPVVFDEQMEPLAFVLASPDILPTSSALPTNDDESIETEGAAGDNEVVYSVVTTEKVNDMIAEYKRRKQRATMPSTPPRARANPFRHSADEGSEEANGCLEEELKESRLKDGDARCLAWSEMTLGMVHLVMSQPTPCFKKLLPMFYKSFMLLTAGSTDMRVRQTMADMLALIEETFHFLESH